MGLVEKRSAKMSSSCSRFLALRRDRRGVISALVLPTRMTKLSFYQLLTLQGPSFQPSPRRLDSGYLFHRLYNLCDMSPLAVFELILPLEWL